MSKIVTKNNKIFNNFLKLMGMICRAGGGRGILHILRPASLKTTTACRFLNGSPVAIFSKI